MNTTEEPDFFEQLSSYFSTLNPLAAKIYSDILRTEESIKYLPSSQNLSYDQKCAYVDKVLIHDKVNKTFNQSEPSSKNKSQSESSDPFFNESQTATLLKFVVPKKPERYVFDENGCWVDEFSEPFSFTKVSQISNCELEKLYEEKFKNENLPHHIHNEPNLLLAAENKNGSVCQNNEKNEKKIKKKKAPFFGVNVMGLGAGGDEREKEKTEKFVDTQEISETNDLDEESNLPQQKQNLDLIAELQAKLKKSKPDEAISKTEPSNAKTLNNDCTKSEVKVELRKSGKILSRPNAPVPSPPQFKVNKPKAPPPPPPKNEKMESNENEKMVKKTDTETNKEEFLVDISSPSRIITPKTGFDFLDNW